MSLHLKREGSAVLEKNLQSVFLRSTGLVASGKNPLGMAVGLFLLWWLRRSWRVGAEEGGVASLFQLYEKLLK